MSWWVMGGQGDQPDVVCVQGGVSTREPPTEDPVLQRKHFVTDFVRS